MEDVLFSIADMKDASGKFCVSITVETWEKEHSINTGYGDEANKKLAEIGLVELDGYIQGCYAAKDWDDKEALQNALEQAGFIPNKEFDKWLDG